MLARVPVYGVFLRITCRSHYRTSFVAVLHMLLVLIFVVYFVRLLRNGSVNGGLTCAHALFHSNLLLYAVV